MPIVNSATLLFLSFHCCKMVSTTLKVSFHNISKVERQPEGPLCLWLCCFHSVDTECSRQIHLDHIGSLLFYLTQNNSIIVQVDHC